MSCTFYNGTTLSASHIPFWYTSFISKFMYCYIFLLSIDVAGGYREDAFCLWACCPYLYAIRNLNNLLLFVILALAFHLQSHSFSSLASWFMFNGRSSEQIFKLAVWVQSNFYDRVSVGTEDFLILEWPGSWRYNIF